MAPRDGAGLAVFRVLFGLLGLVSALRFMAYGWIDELFVAPRFYFHYWGLSWLRPLGESGMHAVFAVIAIASVCVALGLFYRVAIVVLFVAFTYVGLLDVTNYLNHYYLVSLLALLASFMPLSRSFSVDALLSRRALPSSVPAWCYGLLRAQVGIVYFYAGLAKVTGDWLLHAQPLNIWLTARTGMPVLGPLFAEPWVPHAMAWMGCAFDLTVPLWLSIRRTRPFAFAAVLAFHALTKLLFPIGMFPFIMIVAATVFFDPSWPRRLLRWRGQASAIRDEAARVASTSKLRQLGLAVALLYVAVQIAAPLRTHLYGGNVLWHEQGMRFSWRVMVREKNASVTYLVEDATTGKVAHVSPHRYLTDRQERDFATQPDLILQLAHHVARDYEARWGGPVRVRADVVASLNGRSAARLIDPEIDLARVRDSHAPAAFILPAPEGAPPALHPTRWNQEHRSAQR
jgi:hypothetical protein